MRSPYKFACVRCAGRCIPNCSASKLRDGKQAMFYKYGQLNRITKSRSLAFGNNAYAARSGEQKYDEDYSYDAMGNRVAKIVSTPTKSDTTAYARDASGNVMTIYDNRTATEAPIYGSGRIGEYMGGEKEGYQTFNLRKYELTNHLGNVLAVISDKVNLYGHNNILDSARAAVMSASDYYPFGLPMKGRQFDEKNYRFGFNGKENDKEFGWQDYGMRMYMQSIGRFPSVDPLASHPKQIGNSAYSAFNNNPIRYIDPTGMIWKNPKEAKMLNKSVNSRLESLGKNSANIQSKIDK